MLRHLRREENRACTCSKVSFIEVKRWVMEIHQNLTKNDDAKSRKMPSQNSTKNDVVSLFFREEALPESSSCVRVVTISRKGPQNVD